MSHHSSNAAPLGASYFLGFLGAVIYYWQHAETFLAGVAGFFMALFWPAFLIYGLYGHLNF